MESGFVNNERAEINNPEQAVELAKKECIIAYGSINVAFDAEEKIYRVDFFTENTAGGGQSIYIDQNGITKLVVYGE